MVYKLHNKVMKKLMLKIKDRKGFSLIELSIVLVVVGIMMYGATELYSYSAEKAKIDNTNSTLDAVEKALRLYYQTNDDLPCPADGTLALDDGNFGKEDCGVSIYDDVSRGVVPTRALNLPDSYMFDAWGNRISYFVSKFCWTVGVANWTTCSSQTTLARIYDNTNNASGTDTEDSRTSRAAYVLVSYAKDGVAAWRRDGGANRIPSTVSTTAPEIDNAGVDGAGGLGAGADGNFRDDFARDWKGTETGSGIAGQAGTYYDDIVRWKTPEQISYRH